jgi:hypothetical protein
MPAHSNCNPQARGMPIALVANCVFSAEAANRSVRCWLLKGSRANGTARAIPGAEAGD